MLGEILLGIMDGAVQTASNEVEIGRQQTALNIEMERTKQAKEETKRQIAGQIVNGVFDFLNACANDSQTRR